MSYNFDIKLKSTKGYEIRIDTSALYGYWEYPNGADGGGGLWFEIDTSAPDGSNRLYLIDYDGTSALSQSIVKALRENNILVDMSFY